MKNLFISHTFLFSLFSLVSFAQVDLWDVNSALKEAKTLNYFASYESYTLGKEDTFSLKAKIAIRKEPFFFTPDELAYDSTLGIQLYMDIKASGEHVWHNEIVHNPTNRNTYYINHKKKSLTIYSTDSIGHWNGLSGNIAETLIPKKIKLCKDCSVLVTSDSLSTNIKFDNVYDDMVSDFSRVYTIDNSSFLPTQISTSYVYNKDTVKSIVTYNFESKDSFRQEQDLVKKAALLGYKTEIYQYKTPKELVAGDTISWFNGKMLVEDGTESWNLNLNADTSKTLTLDFGYKNCPPCLKSLPHLDSLSSLGTQIFWINAFDSPSEIHDLLENQELKSLKSVSVERSVTQELFVNIFPTMYVLNFQNGNWHISEIKRGFGGD